ncbi:MAG: LicD family protein [Idiomarina sp.]
MPKPLTATIWHNFFRKVKVENTIMKKALLFGAGLGASLYLQRKADEKEFIAFIDNDQSKYGSEFCGLPILSPTALAELEFDEIIITTQWVAEVKRQLIAELGIAEEKVIVPLKRELKPSEPFRDTTTLQFATQVLQTISAAAVRDNMYICVDFGTLLGLVRDQQILPWDDDIDFSIRFGEAEEIAHWLSKTLENSDLPMNWQLDKQTNAKQEVVGLQLKWPAAENKLLPFITSFSCRQLTNGQSVHMPSLGMWYAPGEHFVELQEQVINEQVYWFPVRPEAYLQFLYGDWKTPKQDMRITDYANVKAGSFEEFAEAKLKVDTWSESD